MATDTLTLFCIFSGDSSSQPFKVKIQDPHADVSDLKEAIIGVVADTYPNIKANELVLWHVAIPDDGNIPTLDTVHKKILRATTKLSKAFGTELPEDTIHVIVERPKAASRPQTLELEVPRLARMVSNGIVHIIEEIQGTFNPRGRVSDSAPKLSSMMMPLLERPLDRPVSRVVENVINCFGSKKDEQVAKVLSSFLVCSGTAGIGKTRYGQELNNYLRLNLSKKFKENGLDYSPCHYYMVLDFSKDAMLRQFEAKLDAEIILGLRLAYFHFFQGKYLESFADFHYRAMENYRRFTISNVIIAIHKSLQLPAEQPIFLFLHIDEFQKIFDHRWEGTPARHRTSLPETGIQLVGDKTKGHTEEGLSLFKDMMHVLGNYMTGTSNPHMIQTFLSGSARREVTLAAKPTLYSFEFLSCPLLSLGACYDIMEHFMKPESVRPCQWIPKKGILHLLSATGGLPRALQLLLEEFFGPRLKDYSRFLETLPEIDEDADAIFSEVGTRLDQLYTITDFAKAHKDLVYALVRLCLLREPVERHLAPSKQFPQYTLDVLEREMHTILEDSHDNDGRVLVRIPFFFLSRYNKVVEQVRSRLKKIFVQDWEASRGWDSFEGIVADFEALRTNLLFGDRKTATLGQIYCGAMGRPETLNRIVKLKELSVVTLIHRFPCSRKKRAAVAEGQELDSEGQELNSERQELEWRADKVLKNAAGASFADVFVCRESFPGSGKQPTVAGEQELDWKADKVFKNAARASFADVFVCRESVCPESSRGNGDNGDNILFALQAKKWTAGGFSYFEDYCG